MTSAGRIWGLDMTHAAWKKERLEQQVAALQESMETTDVKPDDQEPAGMGA